MADEDRRALWESCWQSWTPEQRAYRVRSARRTRNIWFAFFGLSATWNVVYATLTWDEANRYFAFVIMWCLSIFVQSICYECAWKTHDFVAWSREKQ